MKNPWVLVILFLCYSNSVFSQEKIANTTQKIKQNDMSNKTPEEWKKILNNEEYRVLIEKGTEYPHTGEYNTHFENGHIFRYTERIFVGLHLLESPRCQLSNGSNLVKICSVQQKTVNILDRVKTLGNKFDKLSLLT